LEKWGSRHLFIFSSETGEMLKLLSKLGLLVLLVGGSMQILFFAARGLETSYYEDGRYEWVNRLALQPKVLIMGSSTAEDDISSIEMSHALGLRSGEVVDVGMIESGPLQMLHCWNSLGRGRDSVKIVLMGIDPWIAYQSYDWIQEFPTVYWTPWQRLYTLSDSRYPSFVLTGRVLVAASHKWISRLFGSQTPTLTHTINFGSLTLLEKPKNFREHTKEYFGETSVFPLSKLYVQRMLELKRVVEKAGSEFVLFLPPKRKIWVKEYDRDCIDLDSELVSVLNGALGPTRMVGSFRQFPSMSDDSIFADHTHLNGIGQRLFSDSVAARLYTVLALKPQYLHSLSAY
jgi:hypothetical protein